MNVLPFRPRQQTIRQTTGPLSPPAALGRYGSNPGDDGIDIAEDRRRMQQNVAALLVVVAIVTLGGWLIDRLMTYSRTMACLEAGHRNCKPLDIEPASPWLRADSAKGK